MQRYKVECDDDMNPYHVKSSDGACVLYDDAQAEIARLTAERDQALKVLEREKKDHRDFRNKMGGKIRHLNARAAAEAMEMRKRAAVTYAMYSGVDLTKRLLSLPIDPDAAKALNQMLNEAYKAGQRDMRERAEDSLTSLAAVLRKSGNSYHQPQASALLERSGAIRALPIKERNE